MPTILTVDLVEATLIAVLLIGMAFHSRCLAAILRDRRIQRESGRNGLTGAVANGAVWAEVWRTGGTAGLLISVTLFGALPRLAGDVFTPVDAAKAALALPALALIAGSWGALRFRRRIARVDD